MTLPFATWDLLKDLGFLPDPTVRSEIQPGLNFHFGDLTLSAGAVTTGWRLTPVVMFTGIMRGRNFVSEVHFEMPRTVDSPETCAAWITWHLDQICPDYRPAKGAIWLAVGRANKLLLPWVADMEAYERRPRCTVQREWARMMLKSLKAALSKAWADDPVYFEFDGALLIIRYGELLIPGQAKGRAWESRYVLKACQLKELPRILKHPDVCFSVWNSRLHIANWSYEGLAEEALSITFPENPPLPRRKSDPFGQVSDAVKVPH